MKPLICVESDAVLEAPEQSLLIAPVPIYFATGDRKKAMRLSFLSGLSEPLGALLAFLFIMPFINDAVLGIIFAVISGIMVFISFDELLPSSQKYGNHHVPTYGVVVGMGIMAFSLLLLG